MTAALFGARLLADAGVVVGIGILVVRALAAQPPACDWVRPREGSPRLMAPLVLLGAVALAFTGHSEGSTPTAGDVFLVTVHVVSAGMWGGGIVALALQRVPGGWRSAAGEELMARFSRVAGIAFAITAFTGVIRASEALSGLGDLVNTAYGLVLVLKTAGVVAMVVLSAMAWRRRAVPPRLEALLALFVIAMATLLYTVPLPPMAPIPGPGAAD